ncbi:hypothetical protein [Streptomyces avermitilis]|uniref:hypothetical protein n=1 Tax=Streptomyces avermitilis TaxID=33903 RepID=UPI0038159149
MTMASPSFRSPEATPRGRLALARSRCLFALLFVPLFAVLFVLLFVLHVLA